MSNRIQLRVQLKPIKAIQLLKSTGALIGVRYRCPSLSTTVPFQNLLRRKISG